MCEFHIAKLRAQSHARSYSDMEKRQNLASRGLPVRIAANHFGGPRARQGQAMQHTHGPHTALNVRGNGHRTSMRFSPIERDFYGPLRRGPGRQPGKAQLSDRRDPQSVARGGPAGRSGRASGPARGERPWRIALAVLDHELEIAIDQMTRIGPAVFFPAVAENDGKRHSKHQV